MPSSSSSQPHLPTHINRLEALVAHSKSRSSSASPKLSLSMLGRRPFLRWFGLLAVVLSLGWFLSPLATGGAIGGGETAPWRDTLGETWGKVKEKVPWVDKWHDLPLPEAPVTQPHVGDEGKPHAGEDEEKEKEKKTEEEKKKQVEKEKWDLRKNKVKNAFARAYVGYRNHAFPKDEILPKSGAGVDRINGWSLTAVESLSTMWLMDMKTEFWRTVQMLERKGFEEHSGDYIPFFETVIRYLGGYLSAYALSGEKLLLTLADTLGQQLLWAFKTESGLPAGNVRAVTHETHPGAGVLAEIASCQLEFKYLAKETGRAGYYERAEGVMQALYNSTSDYKGLFPEHWTISSRIGEGTGGHYSIGGNADSAYEYMLKQFLQAGDRQALDGYLKSIKGILDNMLYISPTRGLLYVTDLNLPWTPADSTPLPPSPSHKLEHLSCFLPGLLALGAYQIPLHVHAGDPPPPPDPEGLKLGLYTRPGVNDGKRPWLTQWELEHKFPEEERERHRWAAEGLAYTCWVLYGDQKSGVGPDEVRFSWGAIGASGGSSGGAKWADVYEAWRRERAGEKKKSGSENGNGKEEDESEIDVAAKHKGKANVGADEGEEEEEDRRERRQAPPDEGKEGVEGKEDGKEDNKHDRPPGTREPPPEKDVSKRDYNNGWPDRWLMRPETVESIYILWKTTGNAIWRERGWSIFQAFEKWAKTPYGYSSLMWVDRGEEEGGPDQMDEMPSYFLAETLKYLYLLFDDSDPITFDKWVFNTEAHPLPVFNWTERERVRFRVAY